MTPRLNNDCLKLVADHLDADKCYRDLATWCLIARDLLDIAAPRLWRDLDKFGLDPIMQLLVYERHLSTTRKRPANARRFESPSRLDPSTLSRWQQLFSTLREEAPDSATLNTIRHYCGCVQSISICIHPLTCRYELTCILDFLSVMKHWGLEMPLLPSLASVRLPLTEHFSTLGPQLFGSNIKRVELDLRFVRAMCANTPYTQPLNVNRYCQPSSDELIERTVEFIGYIPTPNSLTLVPRETNHGDIVRGLLARGTGLPSIFLDDWAPGDTDDCEAFFQSLPPTVTRAILSTRWIRRHVWPISLRRISCQHIIELAITCVVFDTLGEIFAHVDFPKLQRFITIVGSVGSWVPWHQPAWEQALSGLSRSPLLVSCRFDLLLDGGDGTDGIDLPSEIGPHTLCALHTCSDLEILSFHMSGPELTLGPSFGPAWSNEEIIKLTASLPRLRELSVSDMQGRCPRFYFHPNVLFSLARNCPCLSVVDLPLQSQHLDAVCETVPADWLQNRPVRQVEFQVIIPTDTLNATKAIDKLCSALWPSPKVTINGKQPAVSRQVRHLIAPLGRDGKRVMDSYFE